MNKEFEKFNVEIFKQKYCKSDEQIAEAQSILERPVEDFYNHYIETHYGKLKELDKQLIATTFKSFLNSPCVNSIKSRVKDPYHLIDKLIRKTIENVEYRNINIDNYHLYLDDLLGFRLILLYMDDWCELHNLILKQYAFDSKNFVKKEERIEKFSNNTEPFFIALPEINIRNGDDEVIYTSKFTKSNDKNFKVKKGRYYRSIHYSIFHTGYCFEIQVRSVFDEAWSEIDHDMLYPINLHNEEFINYSKMLNRITGISNEMASYFKNVIGTKFVNDSGIPMATLRSVPNELEHSHIEHNKLKDFEMPDEYTELSVNNIIDEIVKGENI